MLQCSIATLQLEGKRSLLLRYARGKVLVFSLFPAVELTGFQLAQTLHLPRVYRSPCWTKSEYKLQKVSGSCSTSRHYETKGIRLFGLSVTFFQNSAPTLTSALGF